MLEQRKLHPHRLAIQILRPESLRVVESNKLRLEIFIGPKIHKHVSPRSSRCSQSVQRRNTSTSLAKRDRISVSGSGRLAFFDRRERFGRNPHTWVSVQQRLPATFGGCGLAQIRRQWLWDSGKSSPCMSDAELFANRSALFTNGGEFRYAPL